MEADDEFFSDGPFSTGLRSSDFKSTVVFPAIATTPKPLTPVQERSSSSNNNRRLSTEVGHEVADAKDEEITILMEKISLVEKASSTPTGPTTAATFVQSDSEISTFANSSSKKNVVSRFFPKRGESQLDWQPFTIPFAFDINLLPSGQLVFLDTETTGLATDYDRVIEIGMVLRDYETLQEKRWYSLLNPEGKRSGEGAFKAHCIEDARLYHEPKFIDVLESFLTFIGDRPIVMHNASFDDRMLAAELRRVIKKYSIQQQTSFDPDTGRLLNPIFCTLNTAKLLRSSNNKLDDLCDEFGVDKSVLRKDYHGALQDTLLLADVFPYIFRSVNYRLLRYTPTASTPSSSKKTKSRQQTPTTGSIKTQSASTNRSVPSQVKILTEDCKSERDDLGICDLTADLNALAV
jgi:DNA polymerase-3 subunit epsilon